MQSGWSPELQTCFLPQLLVSLIFPPLKGPSGAFETIRTKAKPPPRKKKHKKHKPAEVRSYYFWVPSDLNAFYFIQNIIPNLFLLPRLFLIRPRILSHLISSRSFPCYLCSRTVLTNPWTSQASTLPWASACDKFAWLSLWLTSQLRSGLSAEISCWDVSTTILSKTQSPLTCVLCFTLCSSYHHLWDTLKKLFS